MWASGPHNDHNDEDDIFHYVGHGPTITSQNIAHYIMAMMMHLLLRMMMRMLMLMPDPSVSVCSGDVRSVGRGGVGLGAPVFPGAGAGDRGCTSGGGGPSEGGFCWLCKNLHSSTPPGKNHCSAAILTQAAQAGGESSKSVVQHCSSETIGSADNTGESANPGETDAMRVLLEWIICCCHEWHGYHEWHGWR